MKMQLTISGRIVHSIDLPSIVKSNVDAAVSYFKKHFRKEMDLEPWEIALIVESRVNAEIRKLDVLHPKRTWEDEKIDRLYRTNHREREKEKEMGDRSSFTKYSNRQFIPKTVCEKKL